MRTIIFNTMNITAKIEELDKELAEQWSAKDKAEARIKELNLQIKKLRTIARHAQEIFAEPTALEKLSEDV